MQSRKSEILNPWTVIFIVVAALVWVLSFPHVASAGYADSVHGDTSDGVNRSGTSYAIGSCAHCHDTFDSGICAGLAGPHMLFTGMDDPDFCMECHTDSGSIQVGGMSAAPGNIENVFTTKTYKHNVLGYSGLHKFWPWSPPADAGDVENRTYLSANKHVECNDCHNPHLAEAGLHSSNHAHVAAGTNDISDSGPLQGAFGVTYTPAYWDYYSSWTAGGAASWPSTSSTATKEYETCFKCHTDYNTSYASWGGAETASWTNLALEFNPNKQSYHPVVQSLPTIDPGYEYDDPDEYDRRGSNRLPPAFTSLLIGDSGFSSGVSEFSIGIDPDDGNGKRWVANEWVNWGVRVGTLTVSGNSSYNQVGRITGNTTTSLSVSWQSIIGLSTSGGVASDTVYSIEYYAGKGSRSGNTVSDTTKNFYAYLPSLAGYVVVITDTAGNNVAEGTVTSDTSTSFTVGSWTIVKGTSVPSGTVGYYFSATGQTMMCSDCHSNDEIATTAAQGPHGSAVKWMLKGRNKAWPTLANSDNGTGTGTLRTIGRKVSGDRTHRSVMDGNDNGDGLFCLNCHSTVSFSKDKFGTQNNGNVHTGHAWPQGPGCVRCHVVVPHGGAGSRMIGDDSMPARYAFNNDISNMYMTYFQKRFDADHTGAAGDPADYAPQSTKGNCYTIGASVGCHHTEP